MADPKKVGIEIPDDVFGDIWSSAAKACGLTLKENTWPASGRHLKGNWSQMAGACREAAKRMQDIIRKVGYVADDKFERQGDVNAEQAKQIAELSKRVDDANAETQSLTRELAKLQGMLTAQKVGHILQDSRRDYEDRTTKVLETIGYDGD